MARIYKRGKLWYVDFEYKGKRYRKSLNTRSKQVAELALKDIDVKIAKERLNLEPPEKIHFEKFAQKFLEWYQVQNSIKSYQDYKNLFNSTIIPNFSNVNLSDITVEMLEKYKQKRSKTISASSVNKELIALQHFFNKAILWGYLNYSPIQKVSKLRVKQRKFRFLTVNEVYQIIEASPPYVKPIFLTAIHTGLRKSELFRLEWDDIDFERKCIVVRNKEDSHTKNYSNREIPMTANLNSELRMLREETKNEYSYVFCKTDGRPHQGDLRKTIATIIKQTGIEPFTLH